MKKRRLLQAVMLAAMLWGGSMQTRADGFAFLTVTEINGEKVDYQLSDIRKITFSDVTMTLYLTNGHEETLPLSTLTEMTVGEGSTGIALIGKDKTGLELKDGTLSLDMADGGTVTLYDAAGKTVRTLQVKAGQNSIAIGQLAKGVYIVKVNGNSQKFINK